MTTTRANVPDVAAIIERLEGASKCALRSNLHAAIDYALPALRAHQAEVERLTAGLDRGAQVIADDISEVERLSARFSDGEREYDLLEWQAKLQTDLGLARAEIERLTRERDEGLW